MNRRNFLKSIGLGAVAAIVPAPEAKPEPTLTRKEWEEEENKRLVEYQNQIFMEWMRPQR